MVILICLLMIAGMTLMTAAATIYCDVYNIQKMKADKERDINSIEFRSCIFPREEKANEKRKNDEKIYARNKYKAN